MNKSLKAIIESQIGEAVLSEIYGSGKIRTESGKEYFLKTGPPTTAYACEANGLKELTKPAKLHIAKVISFGETYLLTEHIAPGLPSINFHREFGKNLAKMHQYKSKAFGFFENNFIGVTPQINVPEAEEETDWTAFYFNKRLLFQYKLAEANGYITEVLRKGFNHIEKIISSLLNDSKEPPTLLHGDLWSGNYLCNKNGDAALIDPAVYYGHREADLAMTKVFGGFHPEFYSGYMEESPLAEGWEERENLYKLYHILNHLNIFGNTYLAEAEYLASSFQYR